MNQEFMNKRLQIAKEIEAAARVLTHKVKEFDEFHGPMTALLLRRDPTFTTQLEFQTTDSHVGIRSLAIDPLSTRIEEENKKWLKGLAGGE